MRKYIIIPALTIVFLFAACKKTIDSLTSQLQNVTQQPATTSIGSATGNAVSKTIGSSGGSITSEDGKLELIVPAGAVNSDTVFSIQPISNYCPGGLNAFRLLPDGMTFSNPVTLKFNYTNEDVNGSLAALFTIAYQGKDNIWYSLPATEIDSINKTISVQTTHFTDWSDVSGLKINSDVNSLEGNQEAELTLEGSVPASDNNETIDRNTHFPIGESQKFLAKWYVNGVENGNSELGEIIVSSGDNKTVQYKAPAIIKTATTVIISAELTDLSGHWNTFDNSNKITFNNITLTKQIVLAPDKVEYDFYLESTDDAACGAPGSFVFDAVQMRVTVNGDNVTITNIVNQVPSIINPSVQSFNCTVTATPGPNGPINITSVTGFVYTSSQSPTTRGVTLAIVNSETSTENCSQQCATTSQSSAAQIETDSVTSYYSFDLVDSVQSFGTKGHGGYWTFSPK